MIKEKGKKGVILAENIIFIVLNLLFLVILILFLVSRMSNTAGIEEEYAKQIALLIDYSKPNTVIYLNMEKVFEKKDKNIGLKDIVAINNEKNIVTVKLTDGKGYSYGFFNDVNVNAYPDSTNNKEYVFIINEK